MSEFKRYSLRPHRSYETRRQSVALTQVFGTPSGKVEPPESVGSDCEFTPKLSATQSTMTRSRRKLVESASQPSPSTRTPRSSKQKKTSKKPSTGKKESGDYVVAASVPLEVEDLRLELIYNNMEPTQSAVKLLHIAQLKTIFETQLPHMPKYYVARLVFDANHRNLALISQKRGVVGGVCFRKFRERGFVELVFLAVSEREQVKGYGTYLMNNFKEFLRSDKIFRILTYADENAVLFFEKHGFYNGYSVALEKFSGAIKHYRGAVLMECRIRWNRHYSTAEIILADQTNGFAETNATDAMGEGSRCFA